MKLDHQLVVFLAVAWVLAVHGRALAFSGGPPDESTGAPGESTCQSGCHDSFSLNSGPGSLTLNVPFSYTPGQVYTIAVNLSQIGQMRWGFELTALKSDGTRAGTLTPPDGNMQVSESSGKQYMKHTSAGTAFGKANGTSWNFNWTAPQPGVGSVTFYAAGNAANGNGNNQGDYIYTTTGISTVEIPAVYGVTLAVEGETSRATDNPVEGVTYPLRVTNTGNRQDTINLLTSAAVGIEGPVVESLSKTLVDLGAGSSETITLTVRGDASTKPGNYPVTVTASSTGDNSKIAQVTTMTTIQAGVIDVAPTTIDFGEVHTRSVLEKTLTIGNSGNIALEVTSITSSRSEFSVDTTQLPLVLSPGQNRLLTIRFQPITNGDISGALTIASSVLNSPTTIAISARVSLVIVSIAIAPSPPTLKAGERQPFTVSAFDADNHVIEIRNTDALWAVDGNIGTIDETGLFRAETVGSGTIRAQLITAPKITAQTNTVTVQAGALAKLIIPSAPTALKVGNTHQLTINGVDAFNNAVAVQNTDVTWEVIGDIGSVDSAGNFLATQAGSGRIKATLKAEGNITATITLTVIGPAFDLRVSGGIRLIHLPLAVTTVNDKPMKIQRIGDFYDALGGADNVNFIITRDTSAGVWRSFLGNQSKGTSADLAITDEMGIITIMKNPVTLRLKGDALGANGVSQIRLKPGTNLVGVPLKSGNLKSVSDLLRLEGIAGNATAIIVSDEGAFKVVARAGDDGDIPLTGGQAFIITARQAGIAEVTGMAWGNLSE